MALAAWFGARTIFAPHAQFSASACYDTKQTSETRGSPAEHRPRLMANVQATSLT